MSSDSTKKTILVALGVCLVCSVLVSTAAVALSKIQDENKKLDKLTNILSAGELLKEGKDVTEIYMQNIKPVMVELQSGELLPNETLPVKFNIENFDIKTLASDKEFGVVISSDKDIAGIKRKPKNMVVYEVVEDEEIVKYILPIYGKGLWSTLYGFLALGSDLKTIQGFTFYEHGETPGLGGEVDNPKWKAQWKGKQAFDDEWNIKITVLKGRVDNSRSDSKYQIDGLSGSTLTSRGVDALVKFWLGEEGYGPFIKKLRGVS